MYHVFVWLPFAREWAWVEREYPSRIDAIAAVRRLAEKNLDAYVIGW
jgi:hypothetical protein